MLTAERVKSDKLSLMAEHCQTFTLREQSNIVFSLRHQQHHPGNMETGQGDILHNLAAHIKLSITKVQ